MTEIVFALLFCNLLPVLFMSMLFPSLEEYAPRQGNFRDRSVFVGLGIVWLLWIIFIWMGATAIEPMGFSLPSYIVYLLPIVPLIMGTCAFGLFDDWVGDNSYKGFKGHLRAFVRGKLTTGGLKMLGIGFLAFFLSFSYYYTDALSMVTVILSTCVIALCANLMNLFDLRPTRAHKAYLILLVPAFIWVALAPRIGLDTLNLVALFIAAVGPVAAVWRFDAREQAMLGDAGANAMGAFIGYLYATALPIWALAPMALVLFVVNLLSERISFTSIIAAHPFLDRLDQWGRSER
jgi:UDP-GlcNAc:undecaprenyl-phosphate/decaprenyl-phosphate GlcNAc-1-phosphate transferase